MKTVVIAAGDCSGILPAKARLFSREIPGGAVPAEIPGDNVNTLLVR
jgi:hypothetical protein